MHLLNIHLVPLSFDSMGGEKTKKHIRSCLTINQRCDLKFSYVQE